ncbi:hypothetical protein G6F40_015400 [Rhizopus arrhizus]|nr:hypothetical protein G6F40_015400 [Rhizopus arrhizus]
MRRQEALLLLDGDSAHADRASDEKLPFDLALAGLSTDVQDALRSGMEAYQVTLLGYTAARVGLDVEAQSLLDTAAGVAPALAAFQQAQVAALAEAQARQQAGTRTMSPGAGPARGAPADPGHPALRQRYRRRPPGHHPARIQRQ